MEHSSSPASPSLSLPQLHQEDILLSVLIPCFNEEATVGALVREVRSIPLRTEIICVDDASTDGTREQLGRLAQDGLVDHFLVHPENRGKGAAIRTALAAATGELAVVQDADLEYSPQEIPRLVEPILSGKADAVFGSRFRGGHPGRVLYFWHRLGNGLLTLMSNMLTNLNLTDMETCYKVLRRDLAQGLCLQSNRFGFEPEVTAQLAKAQARIYEVGISYYGRTYKEGKKISWRDGIAALWHILRFNSPFRHCPVDARQLPPLAELVASRRQ
jgi:glycosyltransferase involved in cell wall biosynthesis